MAGGAAVSTGGRRGGLPQTAAMLNLLSDLAFNLLIFFVVLADPTTDTGRPQQVPAATPDKADTTQAPQNIELLLSRTTVKMNGQDVAEGELAEKLRPLLAAKSKPEDKIVVVRSAKDTPYRWWILITARVEQAGGVVALQLEEEQEVTVK